MMKLKINDNLAIGIVIGMIISFSLVTIGIGVENLLYEKITVPRNGAVVCETI